jgi:hypothetical protein
MSNESCSFFFDVLLEPLARGMPRSEINLSALVTDSQKSIIFIYNLKQKIMYSLDCNYYEKQFSSIDQLIDDVIQSGMDPNYEITYNGKGIGDRAIDLIQF